MQQKSKESKRKLSIRLITPMLVTPMSSSSAAEPKSRFSINNSNFNASHAQEYSPYNSDTLLQQSQMSQFTPVAPDFLPSASEDDTAGDSTMYAMRAQHAPHAHAEYNPIAQPMPRAASMSAADGTLCIPVPCHFGNSCTNTNCPFLHPVKASPLKNCLYGQNCSRPDCYFAHPNGRQELTAPLSPEGSATIAV